VGEEYEVGTLNGEPVYRRVWDFTITQAANVQHAIYLSSATDNIDRLIQLGGSWETGNGRETYFMSPWITTTVPYGIVLLGITGRFELYTRTPQARNDARTLIWVDYTKTSENGVHMASGKDRSASEEIVEIPIEHWTKLLSQ